MFSHRTRMRILEGLRRFFGGNPPRMQAAALPWRQVGETLEVMLVTSRRSRRWVLPKGWPEAGDEHLAETAVREAFEEAGVEGIVGEAEIGRYLYGKATGSGFAWRCEVVVYALRVEREAERWPEGKKRIRRWMSPAEAAGLVEEPDLAEIIAEFDGNPREIAA